MELYEAMGTLRAVRRLRPDPIPEDVLERIFTAATWAPTGGNMQPWRLIAVRDPAKKQILEDLYRPYWDTYVATYRNKMLTMPADAQRKSERTLAAGDHLAQHLHAVPVIAVFCFNPGIIRLPIRTSRGRLWSAGVPCIRRCRICCSRAATKASAVC